MIFSVFILVCETVCGSCVTADPCTATEVEFSNFADAGSITGATTDTVSVECNQGYSGDDVATCQADGTFTTVTCTGELHLGSEMSAMPDRCQSCDMLTVRCVTYCFAVQ